jgi:hypothetical protein
LLIAGNAFAPQTVNIYTHFFGLVCAVTYSFFVTAYLMKRDTWAEALV